MITSLVFGIFYLNINNQFQLGFDVARNTTAYQEADNNANLIYLSPRDSHGVDLWGITYLPLITDPSLDYCLNDSSIPPRQSNSSLAYKKGLTVVTIDDVPEFSTLIAIAPFVDDVCGRAYADQATADDARILIFINNNENGANSSAMLEAPSGTGALGYSLLSTSQAVGSSVMYEMADYASNTTFSIPDSAYNNSISRVGVEILTESSNALPKLWIAILGILAGVFIIFILMSLVLNLKQIRRRNNLRVRIERGEVNLEALGVRKITVPDEILLAMPIRKYKHGEMHFLNSEERENLNIDRKSEQLPTTKPSIQNNSAGMERTGTESTDDSTDSTSRLHPDKNTSAIIVEEDGETDPNGKHRSSIVKASAVFSESLGDDPDKNSLDDVKHSTGLNGDSGIYDNHSISDTRSSRELASKVPHAILAAAVPTSVVHAKQDGGEIQEETDSEDLEERMYNQTSCPICLEDFTDKEEIRELPCLHIYHPECIDPFLKTRSSLCPMCKVSVLPPGYLPETVKLTNATVRRERVMQRQRVVRSNDAGGGGAPRYRSGRRGSSVRPRVNEEEHRTREQAARRFWRRPFTRIRGQFSSNEDEVPMVDLQGRGNNTVRAGAQGQSHAHGHAAIQYQRRNTTGNPGTGRRRVRANLDALAPDIADEPIESPGRRLWRALFPT